MDLHREARWTVLLILAILTLPLTAAGQRSAVGGQSQRVATLEAEVMEFSGGRDRFWQVTGPFGGDVTILVIDPRRPDHLLAGTSDGVVYQSTDSGRRWRSLQPRSDLAGHTVTGIIFDRSDPERVYVSFKSITALNPGDSGGGLFVSNDLGVTWNALVALANRPIRGIAQSASSPNVLAVATLDGVYRTRDHGDTWDKISPPRNDAMRGYHSVAIDPRNPDKIYVGTSHLPWKTNDDGQTWSLAGSGLTGMLDDSDIFSIQIDEDNPDTLLVSACSGIYRSFDGSSTWTRFKGIPNESRRTQIIRRHPTRPWTIYAGTTEGLWVSDFYGMAESWRRVTPDHLLVNSVAVHPSQPDRIFLGTEDSGVLMSTDGGESWSPANNGLINRQVGAVLADLEERGRVYAGILFDGVSSGIYVSADGGLSWTQSVEGLADRDIYSLHQSPFLTGTVYAGTNRGLYRSDDRGRTWHQIRQTQTVTPAINVSAPARVPTRQASRPRVRTLKPSSRKVRKTAPTASAPSGPSRVDLLYQVFSIHTFIPRRDLIQSKGELLHSGHSRQWLIASTWDGIYLTDDESRGWWRVSIHTSAWQRDTQAAAIATSHQAPGVILIGTRDGLYISTDNGQSFKHQRLGDEHLAVRSITFDPRTAATIYAGTTGGFFRSFDSGKTWEKRGGGMPLHTSVGTIRVNELNPDEIFLSDDLRSSLYYSTDRGTNWEPLELERLPSTLFRSIVGDPFDPQRLYLGTVSGGVYVLSRTAE